MNKETLDKYAKFAITVGLNVKQGQMVNINSSLEQADLAKLLMKHAYEKGASHVEINWTDPEILKMKYSYETKKSLMNIEKWEEEKMKLRAAKKPCIIFIEDRDPNSLAGIDQEKMQKVNRVRHDKFKKYIDALDGKQQWSIIGAASKAWAKSVFPDDEEEIATDKLWKAIFEASRFDPNGDNVEKWNYHNKVLRNRCNQLNYFQFRKLHYISKKTGTDLYVTLDKESKFIGGSEINHDNSVVFSPNIPTEECFTSPDKTGTNGIVYSTKPLSFGGEIIDKFWLKFENGKVVDSHAEVNNDLLLKMLDTDDGARMLGECALISYDSPINNSGIIFYSTLFDENACCHLALGRGFSECLTGKLSVDKKKHNLNSSAIHVDFMIGSDDLSIIGTDNNGNEVVIFENGNFSNYFE